MKTLKNEKGIALVLALVMLAMLSVLGAYALSTSSTELFIAGNYRNTELAFSTSDAGAEYGLNTTRRTFKAWPAPGMGTSVRDNNYDSIPVGTNTADVRVLKVVENGSIPQVGTERESQSEVGAGAAYYIVHSIGYGPSNTRVEVESMMALKLPDSS